MDTASEHDAQGAATLRRFYLLIPVCTRNLIPTSQVSSEDRLTVFMSHRQFLGLFSPDFLQLGVSECVLHITHTLRHSFFCPACPVCSFLSPARLLTDTFHKRKQPICLHRKMVKNHSWAEPAAAAAERDQSPQQVTLPSSHVYQTRCLCSNTSSHHLMGTLGSGGHLRDKEGGPERLHALPE